MYRTRERDDWEQAKDGSVTVLRNFAQQSWNPPLADIIKIPYTIPAYRRYYEKIRDEIDDPTHHEENFGNVEGNSGVAKGRWKSLQHYKCYVADPTDIGVVKTIPWSTESGTSLGTYSWGSRGVPGAVGVGNYADRMLLSDSSTFRAQFGSYGSHNLGIPSLTLGDSLDGFLPKPDGLSTLTRNALSSMLPNIKAEMSAINSVYELKDFISLPKTLSSIIALGVKYLGTAKGVKALKAIHNLDRIPERFRKLHRSFRNEHPTLRQLFHAGADGYLQAEFNILPALRDLEALWHSLSKLESDLRRTLAQSGRRQRRHYSFAWQEYESPLLYVKAVDMGSSYTLGQFAGSYNPPGYTGCKKAFWHQVSCTRRVTHYLPTIFHAELEYDFYYTQFQREHAPLLALLDQMGVNLNPQIIWNAIPWSFVVDWVLGISRWLGRHKTINMEPIVNVHRYLWSWARHQKVAVVFNTTSLQGTSFQFSPTFTDTYLPHLYETTYRRDVQIPDSSISLFGSGLSATELSLGVALAITQAKRPTTRAR